MSPLRYLRYELSDPCRKKIDGKIVVDHKECPGAGVVMQEIIGKFYDALHAHKFRRVIEDFTARIKS